MNALEQYQEELKGNFRAAHLIAHFIMEDLTEEEEAELDQWIQHSEHNMIIFEDLTDENIGKDFLKWYFETDTEKNLQQVKRRLKFDTGVKRIPLWRYVAAACVISITGTLIYYTTFYKHKKVDAPPKNVYADIAPGQSSATLTLASGKQVKLTNIKDTLINKTIHVVNGAVVYSAGNATPEYHELSVPRKGFYQLTLPDGTKVWINSSSSIRYPSQFKGNERRVSVTGETFFEVAKDATHPFIVSVNGIEITALGTAFNVNAYPDEEAFRTTLTEGKIKVQSNNHAEFLTPGQQVVIKANNWTVSNVDPSPVIAWTTNQFKLKNTTIEEVMRMAARWYDAKVIYQDHVTKHFTGTIDRSEPISQLLKLLEATGEVHFKIDSDSIIVTH